MQTRRDLLKHAGAAAALAAVAPVAAAAQARKPTLTIGFPSRRRRSIRTSSARC